MEWQEIRTAAQAAAFMTRVNDFHDGCLREAHVWTGHWVGDDLAMAVDSGLDTHVRLLVQRQYRPLSAVELVFDEVTRFHVRPSLPDHDGIIYEATLHVAAGQVYWADQAGWTPEAEDRDDATWVAGRRLRWRDASGWMGPQLRYGPPDATAPAP